MGRGDRTAVGEEETAQKRYTAAADYWEDGWAIPAAATVRQE